MASWGVAKMGKVRLALLLAGGLGTALTTLAPAPAGAATSLAGSGEEHHEWFRNPPTNQDFGGGTAATAPCIQYKHSTGRAVMISGTFDVPTSGGIVSHPASNTNPIIVTVDIVNNGAGVLHFEGPDGTYKTFVPPIGGAADFSGGCTGSDPSLPKKAGTVVNTDSGTPAPTVTQGTSSTNLCSNATAVSIERDVVAVSQTRRYVFTCKDSSVASATTYTLTGTGLITDPPCNPPLASLDCVLGKAALT